MWRSAIPGPVRDGAKLHPNPKALLQETLVEARWHGISVIEWSRGETGQHSLVVAAAEVAVSEGFVGYTRRVKEAGFWSWLHSTEAHAIVKDERWRTTMSDVWKLAEIDPRRITLSVTVPRYVEDGLTQTLCLDQPRVLRASVVRSNIQYSVRRVHDDESANALLCQLVQADSSSAWATTPDHDLHGPWDDHRQRHCRPFGARTGIGAK